MATTVNRGYRIPQPAGIVEAPDPRAAVRNLGTDVDVDVAALATGYRLLQTVYYTSSGTFIKANFANLRAVEVEVLGGGGGSGGMPLTNASSRALAQSGGGGVWAKAFMLASALLATETVTVGAGGAGGTTGTLDFGQVGGTSSFGSHISASGGPGGNSNSGGTAAMIAIGGGQPLTTSAGGDITVPGGAPPSVQWPASATIPPEVRNAIGAFYGVEQSNNGVAITGSTPGIVGLGYGSGGVGGWSGPSTAHVNGAAGAGGLVIVRCFV